MYKTKGKFEKDGKKYKLSLSVPQNIFDSIRQYVVDNMFLSLKRPAPKLRRIVLNSVGDNINSDGIQNYFKADMFLEVDCSSEEASQEAIKVIEKDPNWYVEVTCDSKLNRLSFTLDKSSDQIIDRNIYG